MAAPESLQRAFELHRAGRLDDAERLYRQVLAREPRNAEAWHLLGVAAQQRGKHAEAIGHLARAIELDPNNATFHFNLATAHAEQGRPQQAIASMREVIRLEPHHFPAHNSLGALLAASSRGDEAAACFRQALAIRPDYAPALVNLGRTLNRQGRAQEAATCFQQAIRLNPDDAQAHVGLGAALHASRQPEKALAAYQRALQIKPDFAEVHNNIGQLMLERGDLAAALARLDRAAQIQPDLPLVHNNRGIVLAMLGRYDEALAHFNRALSIDPDYTDAHFSRATLLLSLGDYASGWSEYEWRLRAPDAPQRPPGPAWNGEPLAGRAILLYAEQGQGDILQFIRYAPRVKARGGRVIVGCAARLIPILSTCQGVDRFFSQHDPVPPFEVHAALASLPGILGTDAHSIPADVPYLSADAELVEQWRAKLPSDSRLRVGINWQGSPTHRDDRRRSMPLAELAPLARVEGVRLFSLQKGFGVEQLAGAPFEVVDLGSRLDEGEAAFCDTAAVIKNLDLVITSDTAVAHLAGALGAPVWVALSLAPDWRWLLEREDSPWYPTMRLWRQAKLDDWRGVFARIADELGALAEKPRSPG
jgi:tetratricopeptide (TPR) repeat protein